MVATFSGRSFPGLWHCPRPRGTDLSLHLFFPSTTRRVRVLEVPGEPVCTKEEVLSGLVVSRREHPCVRLQR